ncbi:MAG: hypothetical protein MUD01_17215 [Chloroflexaceae bacterium]|nr:hypothetical protein [Chloroflexaceae bacterium]
MWFTRPPIVLLGVILLLSACGLPGMTVEAPTPAISATDTRATVEAEVRATLAAQQAPTTPAAPTVAADPTAAAPTLAAPTTVPPAAAAPTAASAPPQPAASGDSLLLALGRDTATLNSLTTQGWQRATVNFLGQTECRKGNTVIDRANTIWVSCSDMISFSRNGTTWEQVPAGVVGDLLLDPTGDVWVVSSLGVSHFVAGTPTTYEPQATIGKRSFPSSGFTFAPDGTLWLAGSIDIGTTDLVSFDGKTWNSFSNVMPTDNQEAPGALFATSKGEVLMTSNGLFKLEGNRFTQLLDDEAVQVVTEGTITFEVRAFLEQPDGKVWMATEYGILVWDGQQLSRIGREQGLPSRDVFALARDGQNRVWAGTSYGLAVQQDGTWEVALPSTSALSDSRIVAVAARGAPALPAAEATPKTTTITGRVSRDNQPVANSQVELCSEIVRGSMFSLTGGGDALDPTTNTPCGAHTYSQLATTDAEGNYRFENVPIGVYELAVKIEDRWNFFYGSLDLKALEPGKTVQFDLPLQ